MLELTPVNKLLKDLRLAARTLSDEEAKYLVRYYYLMQNNRIRSRGQERSLEKQEKPHEIITFFADQDEVLEKQVVKVLDEYTKGHIMGSWMRDIYGIGPVISAGMLALIDMDKAPTVGHIWALAGWAADGQKPWEKGKIKPFSGEFRTLCYKLGDLFKKFSGQEECFYGKIFLGRRAYEDPKNERLEYKFQADAKLLKVGKATEAYKWYVQGKLPPGHMMMRAQRYAVKIFLSHLHQVWYERKYGRAAPFPFAISHLNHAHMIQPPNRVIEDLSEKPAKDQLAAKGGQRQQRAPETVEAEPVVNKKVFPEGKKPAAEANELVVPKKRGRPKKTDSLD